MARKNGDREPRPNNNNFRYSTTVKNTLDKFKNDDNSWNDAFEDLILQAYKEVPVAQKKVKELEKYAKAKEKELSDLNKKIRQKEEALKTISYISRSAESLIKEIEEFTKDIKSDKEGAENE